MIMVPGIVFPLSFTKRTPLNRLAGSGLTVFFLSLDSPGCTGLVTGWCDSTEGKPFLRKTCEECDCMVKGRGRFFFRSCCGGIRISLIYLCTLWLYGHLWAIKFNNCVSTCWNIDFVCIFRGIHASSLVQLIFFLDGSLLGPLRDRRSGHCVATVT